MPETISRDQLIAGMITGHAMPDEAHAMLLGVLADLGWADKQAFAQDDFQAIMAQILVATRNAVAATDAPQTAAVLEGLDQIMGAASP